MKQLFLLIFSALLIFALSFSSASQNTAVAEFEKAKLLLDEQKYAEAETAFEALVRSNPEDARGWFNLGIARNSQKKWKAAIEAFEKNVEISKNASGMYNIAAGYSQLDQKVEAFDWLEKALRSGAAFRSDIAADEDLKNLRSDPRFSEMLTLVDKIRKPCLYSAESRQFDFWIGDWEVFVNGNKVGENLVERELQGCTLVENWKNNAGGLGKSLNSYNAATKKWKQFYVDSSGNVLEFEGSFSDGVMSLKGETIDGKGGKTLHILDFHDLPEKTVRQHWRQSTDEGKTWNTVWDSIYRRKTLTK